jgi:ribosomal protein L32
MRSRGRNDFKKGYNMAIVKCPECKKEISETAEVCPDCGYKREKNEIGIPACPECGLALKDVTPPVNDGSNWFLAAAFCIIFPFLAGPFGIALAICLVPLGLLFIGIGFLVRTGPKSNGREYACKDCGKISI